MAAILDFWLPLTSSSIGTSSTELLDLENVGVAVEISLLFWVWAEIYVISYLLPDVLGMTLNCIHIFIVTGSFLYWCVMRPASQRLFIHSCIYQRILIISYLATFLGTNSLSVLMCRKVVNQSVNIYFRLMAAIFDLRHAQTSDNIPTSLSVLPNPKNMDIAVGISLLSCLEAQIFHVRMWIHVFPIWPPPSWIS